MGDLHTGIVVTYERWRMGVVIFISGRRELRGTRMGGFARECR